MNQPNQNQLPNISADAYERMAILSFILADAALTQSKYATASAAIQRTIAHIEAVEAHAKKQSEHIADLQAKIAELTKKDQ